MANNTHQYGFRPYRCITKMAAEKWSIASGQNDVDDGANSININVGDPVELVNTGGVIVANTTNAVYGICVGIDWYWSASEGRMRKGSWYPNQTTWGTVESRRGHIFVMPAFAWTWEIDVDDNTTFTTRAAYQDCIGENCTHTCPGNTTYGTADPYLDISLNATTNTLVWRINAISDTVENRDFTGENVKLIVSANVSQQAGASASGNAVDGV